MYRRNNNTQNNTKHKVNKVENTYKIRKREKNIKKLKSSKFDVHVTVHR